MVTLDPLTTGFMSDLQLIVQLAIDKCSFKLKVGVQGACNFAATALTQMSLRDLLFNNSRDRENSERKFTSMAAHLVTDTLNQAFIRLKRGI